MCIRDSASTRSKARPLPGDIEPPARNIHMVSEEIKPPALDEGDDTPPQDGAEPEQPEQEESGQPSAQPEEEQNGGGSTGTAAPGQDTDKDGQ